MCEKTVLRKVVKGKKEKLSFELLFVKDDVYQSVEVEEAEIINFEKMEERLEKGESVFIITKRKQHFKTSQTSRKDAAEPWYITHV